MLRITICLLCVFLRWTSPLPQDSELRSIGGKEATEGQFAWQVALFVTNLELPVPSFYCGGSIIDRQWILTAAHCLLMATSVRILAGTTIMHGEQDLRNTVEAAYWKMHERYNHGLALNDIGVIRLTYPLTFNQNIRSIELSSQMLPVNSPIIASGWGVTSNFSPVPTRLRYVSLVTISSESSEYCQYQGNRAFCARSGTWEPKSICGGDSGGPGIIYVNRYPVQVGVNSFVNPPGPCGAESGFESVAYHRNWILQNTMI